MIGLHEDMLWDALEEADGGLDKALHRINWVVDHWSDDLREFESRLLTRDRLLSETEALREEFLRANNQLGLESLETVQLLIRQTAENTLLNLDWEGFDLKLGQLSEKLEYLKAPGDFHHPLEVQSALHYMGLEPRAGLPEVKSRFRKLARDLHPDKQGSHEAMTRLNNAYHILKAYLRKNP